MNIHLVAAKCLHLIMEISITEQTAEDSLIPVRVKLQRLAYECQLSQINSADTCGRGFFFFEKCTLYPPLTFPGSHLFPPFSATSRSRVPHILFLRQCAIIVFKLPSYCTLCMSTRYTISKCCVDLKTRSL